jgi:hypothetical protein
LQQSRALNKALVAKPEAAEQPQGALLGDEEAEACAINAEPWEPLPAW